MTHRQRRRHKNEKKELRAHRTRNTYRKSNETGFSRSAGEARSARATNVSRKTICSGYAWLTLLSTWTGKALNGRKKKNFISFKFNKNVWNW